MSVDLWKQSWNQPFIVKARSSLFSWPRHVTFTFSWTASAPFPPSAGDVRHHSRWEPAGGCMWAYGWLPGGLLEKHSPHQLQPPQPCGNEAARSPALQLSPSLQCAGNKCQENWGFRINETEQEVKEAENLQEMRSWPKCQITACFHVFVKCLLNMLKINENILCQVMRICLRWVRHRIYACKHAD